jgi:hypothetical protein
MKAPIFAALLLAATSVPASAACTWDWLCNGEGQCKLMPVCDSVNEIPPPAPNSQPPAMPPLAMRPHKIAGNMGTLTCEHIMRQGKSGRWYWNEACYCSDPSKGRDPSAPFANIVRCDAPYK